MEQTIKQLKQQGIESFEKNGVLVIPCTLPEDIYPTCEKVRRIFKETGFNKSWQIDPYFYDKKRDENGAVVVGPDL